MKYRQSRHARTLNFKRLTRAERETCRVAEPDDGARRLPMIRGECANVVRPCPFVSCHHHLFVDVSPQTGNPQFNFPDLFDVEGAPELELMHETCVLDVAAREGVTLEAVAGILNLTSERVRQIEMSAVAKLKEQLIAGVSA